MDKVVARLQAMQQENLEKLYGLLRIPSISADPDFKNQVLVCADRVSELFVEAGLDDVRLLRSKGYPAVYGEKKLNPDWPTVLVYGHYDVQPPDPLELWSTEPFEPTVRDGKIFARGASDDKGQFFMHVAAVAAMIDQKVLPCNVKFLIEGEEEVGSVHLADIVEGNRELLAADTILVSDTAMVANDVPSITTGVRGMAYLEVTVTGPNRDLHSGMYGGAVVNPINALCQMVASLHDDQGRVAVPGFYQNVLDMSQAERESYTEVPFDELAYCQELGVDSLGGESGFSPLERIGARPTLDVNGIWGGYTGEGAKTVIASEARAKISMRLVPNQSAEEITHLFEAHFRRLAIPGTQVDVQYLHGGEPGLMPLDSKAYRAASQAYAKTFEKEPLPLRCGGSIPLVSLFKEKLGLDTTMMGFGLDSDAIHSPDESFGLFNFHRGTETIPWFYHFFAQSMQAR
ncbi:MAG: dipeptidase [Granulosicoccaceae bacterium]